MKDFAIHTLILRPCTDPEHIHNVNRNPEVLYTESLWAAGLNHLSIAAYKNIIIIFCENRPECGVRSMFSSPARAQKWSKQLKLTHNSVRLFHTCIPFLSL